MSLLKTLDLVDFVQPDERNNLLFLLNRNQTDKTEISFYLLTASYNLQFPNRLRVPSEYESDVPPESVDDQLMLEAETPSDYWLDSDQIIDSLIYLDLVQILQDLRKNRPFVTTGTYKEAIQKQYKIQYKNNHQWAPIEFVNEYLERFFCGLATGRLNIGTDHYYKLKLNQFNQLVIE